MRIVRPNYGFGPSKLYRGLYRHFWNVQENEIFFTSKHTTYQIFSYLCALKL
jgi:hypothetical protein